MVEQSVSTDIDGVASEQHQQQQQLMIEPQQPALFDMDLERMHVDLYKGKYLTPQDFLDYIRKIVHNASVWMDKDPDRLFKAQAMLTAAQVSIHDFDHGLRLECDRMAVRERQRREEHRKTKGSRGCSVLLWDASIQPVKALGARMVQLVFCIPAVTHLLVACCSSSAPPAYTTDLLSTSPILLHFIPP